MQGFILSRHQFDTATGIELRYWLKHAQGCHLVRIGDQKSVFFVRDDQVSAIHTLLAPVTGWQLQKVDLEDFHYRGVHALYCQHLSTRREVIERLQQASIAMMEEDIRPVDRYLMERFIFGAAEVVPGATGPKLRKAALTPEFRVLSVDIETSMRADKIHSIGLYGDNLARVLMRGQGQGDDSLLYYPDETALLRAFMQQIAAYDPDIFIGWNLVGFDFKVLAERAQALGVPLLIGRDRQPLKVIRSEQGKWYARLEGRLLIDGIDTLKGATYHFESYSLEYVSQQLFGQGKLIHQPDDRGAEIQRLYREDQAALARYNLQDCKLVWDIFATTRLLEYLIERTRLTGLSLDKVGGSAAAFDFQYLPKLHRMGYVAPEYASGVRGDAPGGYVMDSLPGLYRHVLVLDFKSLYPSIIRTFKVDPAGLAEGLRPDAQPEDSIPGFNGAFFSQSRTLLPQIIAELWKARDEAKKRRNQSLSQAIKIIMNAFYGVLGSDVCRFFDQRLSGSITLRGHQILQQTKEEIEAHFGHQVIYGDTDSVFVLLGDQYSDQEAQSRGRELAVYLNNWWQAQISSRFNTASFLELEYETHFSHFLMPRMRHSEKGSKKRYAGLQRLADGSDKLVFKGLENVRSDWTPLARTVQKTLYEAVFRNQPYHNYLCQLLQRLRAGELDTQLIYRRRLRQPLHAYKRMKPPHVQAALKGAVYWEQQGRESPYHSGQSVSYLMTLNGPEPVEDQRSRIDYEHYVEKQLTPVVDAILVFKGESLAELTAAQQDLFMVDVDYQNG